MVHVPTGFGWQNRSLTFPLGNSVTSIAISCDVRHCRQITSGAACGGKVMSPRVRQPGRGRAATGERFDRLAPIRQEAVKVALKRRIQLVAVVLGALLAVQSVFASQVCHPSRSGEGCCQPWPGENQQCPTGPAHKAPQDPSCCQLVAAAPAPLPITNKPEEGQDLPSLDATPVVETAALALSRISPRGLRLDRKFFAPSLQSLYCVFLN
jgi:hypothetical protein